MKQIHESMAMAIFLREHPNVIIEERDGTQFFYSDEWDKYYWHNPKNRKQTGWYEARGLRDWWKQYLNMCTSVTRVRIDDNIHFYAETKDGDLI